jgi:hypothetical protein
MENRTCKKCGIIQDLTLFPTAGIINEVAYYRHLCTQCYSKTKVFRKELIREEYLSYKKTLSCTHCGISDYRVIDFHHLENKSFSLSHALSNGYSMDKIMEEIKKCIPLCANCHRIEHHNENIV